MEKITKSNNLTILKPSRYMKVRVRPRLFDQVGHKTMYASSGIKHFFTTTCHCLTYQNHEQPPWTYQNLYFQSHFSVIKSGRIFSKKKFYEEYLPRRQLLQEKMFLKILIFKILCFLKLCPIFVHSVHNFGKSDNNKI